MWCCFLLYDENVIKNSIMKIYDFSVVITKDEAGLLLASVPSLPGCHTQAKDLNTLLKRIKEAVELYLEVQKMNKKVINIEHFVGIQNIEVRI